MGWKPLAAFLTAVVLGGINFVAVRYSNEELDPIWGAALRFGLAAAVFAVLCAALRLSLPRGRVLALVVTYGLIGFGLASLIGEITCVLAAFVVVPAIVALPFTRKQDRQVFATSSSAIPVS